MTPISFNTGISSTSSIRPGEDSKARQVEPKSYARGTDKVELSAAARQAAADPSGVRTDLVAQVREQIATGTYDSPSRVTIAVDQMTRALRGG